MAPGMHASTNRMTSKAEHSAPGLYATASSHFCCLELILLPIKPRYIIPIGTSIAELRMMFTRMTSLLFSCQFVVHYAHYEDERLENIQIFKHPKIQMLKYIFSLSTASI